ncbi:MULTISPECIES: PIN domain-containing protein [Cyanophyceae]|uniref:PIN domain-containing protein n=1 Tax=Leptolyngbya subtilissima DQ-A4 TaxID=2933933 RepID=A0ABV0K330_9CYAN|nr:PIN domain-containing protein [Nodosilinea sp. FACHB-141]MBD2113084.1 PIN domain-containing protein [Nodosilinea sp. FACHB-141]
MTATAKTYCLDSNIWLYALLKNRHSTSEDLHKAQVSHDLIDASGVVISIQVVNEVCVNLIKKAQFNESQVQSLIQDFYNGCRVIAPDQALLTLASETRDRYSLSFWDGLIVAAALTANVSTLYSEDMQNNLRVFDQLTITNPFL